ncbi:hypothetical protein LTR36_004775 [Oleoguttula mirabilis]|uniref:Uncharacterized protein n=1 Tax=Oleoguttula mirabilis TaxID=1507867 RepID=A0AAV9JG37_9PEZI|nr:hypothetical protein LTR36_004775 [Oleoguttula mirabilis]
MEIVQIVGYNLDGVDAPEQIMQVLSAARQLKLSNGVEARRSIMLVLDIIGSPFMTPGLLQHLPDLFSQLKVVTVHECPRFDIGWVRGHDAGELARLPFGLDVDFAEPIMRINAVTIEKEELHNWLHKSSTRLAIAYWVLEDGQQRLGASILLSQRTMMSHVLQHLDHSATNMKAYDAKDIP